MNPSRNHTIVFLNKRIYMIGKVQYSVFKLK